MRIQSGCVHAVSVTWAFNMKLELDHLVKTDTEQPELD